jgi:hypothetical protein
MSCQAVFLSNAPGGFPSYLGKRFRFVVAVFDPSGQTDPSIPNCFPGNKGLVADCWESGANQYGWVCVPDSAIIVNIPRDGTIDGVPYSCTKCLCNCVTQAELAALQSATNRAIDCNCPCAGSPTVLPVIPTDPDCDGECVTDAQLLALQAAADRYTNKPCQ